MLPPYPAEARQKGVKGVIDLSLRVDGAGNVVAARIIRPLDPKLDELAVNAARTWKYQPAAFGGRTFSTTVAAIVPFLDGAVLGGIVGSMSQPPFNAPTGLAIGNDGTVYVADAGRSLIYKINPAGTSMSAFAGDASEGFKGDGGPALSAQLNVPYDLATDGAGNLYVADTGNSRVRKITPSGAISTVAGNGIAGFSGDGGPAAAAQLNKPLGIAVDASGVLYIADTDNSRIRTVASDGIIRTVFGTGSAGSSVQPGLPYDVAVDTSGNIYVADMTNEKVLRIAANGSVTTMISEPIVALGLATDRTGSLYVADAGSLQVKKVLGGAVSSIRLYPDVTGLPTRVVVDPRGTLYVADGSNGFVRRITGGGDLGSSFFPTR
jgi:TonB family protein